MQITVKESKVIKTGTNEKGTWELIKVLTEDSSEFTTFDKKAKVSSGAILDIGEPKTKNNKLQFDKVVAVIKEAPPEQSQKPGTNGKGQPEMSKEEWANKQRIERESIEAQTAVKAILLLAEGGIQEEHFKQVYEKALDWCEQAIDRQLLIGSKKPAPAAIKAKPSTIKEAQPDSSVEFDGTYIKNLGDLFTRWKNYNITREEGFKILGISGPGDIIDLDEAWQATFKAKFGKGAS